MFTSECRTCEEEGAASHRPPYPHHAHPASLPVCGLTTTYADYTEVDDTSPISSTDNSPFHRPAGVPPMQIKQQAGHAKKSSLDSDKILLDVQAQSHALPTHSSQAKAIEHGSAKPIPPTKPTEHAQKPALASKPSDIAREHKKQELHQKYSKIREELIRKQGHSDAPVSKGAANISGSSQAAGAGPVAKDRPAQRKKPEYKENVKAHVRPKPPKGHKLRSRPSYAEVEPNFEITVEPVPNRVSQTDSDNTMWMRVKYPTMPKKGGRAWERGRPVLATSPAIRTTTPILPSCSWTRPLGAPGLWRGVALTRWGGGDTLSQRERRG